MLESIGLSAKKASRAIARLHSAERKKVLLCIADTLEEDMTEILQANSKDIEASDGRGLSMAMKDRLLLNKERMLSIIADVRYTANLADPVGAIIEGAKLDNGLNLIKRRVPLGVIGVIYEARPNVTIDIASLCLKTGNAAILRGGKETFYSNMALCKSIRRALSKCSLPEDAIQYIDNPDRKLVLELLHLDQYVDMIIPRGGSALQAFCKENSTIPVIIGGVGVCHIFVDKSADIDASVAIVENAKTQRPSACNSVETVLIHKDIAGVLLQKLNQALTPLGVTFHACEASFALLHKLGAKVVLSHDEEKYKEWLSFDLNIQIVDSIEEAITHIDTFGSKHTEAILTNDFLNADIFVNEVDASTVFVNVSTRLTDGGQFGLGAEVAISTQKLHARGPMGLEALTTYKWVGYGDNLLRK